MDSMRSSNKNYKKSKSFAKLQLSTCKLSELDYIISIKVKEIFSSQKSKIKLYSRLFEIDDRISSLARKIKITKLSKNLSHHPILWKKNLFQIFSFKIDLLANERTILLEYATLHYGQFIDFLVF